MDIDMTGHSHGPLVEPFPNKPGLWHRRSAAANFIRAVDLVREYTRQGWELDRAHYDYMSQLLNEIPKVSFLRP